ncbi:MAG: peptidoglycan-associated lipoprotein Pal [Candidatus Auribacterota bacterium]|jgi:peptidoglycan-associated lipoprotein|nr:peptidoglycan-associated lipoprotein Pal [Candidatus Auribacterota bacterium]
MKKHLINIISLGICVTLLAGCQTQQKGKGKSVGSDIPLSTIPADTFIDPPAEYRYIFRNILFDFDSSAIRSDMKQSLNEVSSWLIDHQGIKVRMEGHCDERGTEEYNLALGERRALSVRAYLVQQGVSPQRLFTVSYGEERPANPGHNEFAWAENRRVEFKVSQ